jgi:hypothetical protein
MKDIKELVKSSVVVGAVVIIAFYFLARPKKS